MFDDHFVVESPGILPGMVRINNIREFHFSRNPKIVELLNEYDLVKEFGEGVDRIYRDMEAAGLPEPSYKQSEFMLYAELKNKNWGVEDASWNTLSHSTTQTDISLSKLTEILEFCNEPRTRAELQEFCGYKSPSHFREKILAPLLAGKQLILTIPEKPNSPKQKYVRRTSSQT